MLHTLRDSLSVVFQSLVEMAINAYCGLQGSGKSYEVVSAVIMPAIEAGRRVVTNIDGIDEASIHAYVQSLQKRDLPKQMGSVFAVTNDRIMQPKFFPNDASAGTNTIVEPGDLVVIDEAWRFWPSDGGKLLPEHMQFFRMHRHYTHPKSGVACDVALIIQDISGLHRSVKNVVELSFRTTKLKALGLSGSYRLEMYEGYKQTRKSRIDVFVKRYNKAIFPLYKSYAHYNGAEATIDRRQNIFRNPTLWFVAVLMLCLGCSGMWIVWRFFRPRHTNQSVASVKHDPRSSTDAPSNTVEQRQAMRPRLSSNWRVVGRVSASGQILVILRGPEGRLRLEHASHFTGMGMNIIGKVDGDVVTTYTGPGNRQ